MNHHRPFGRSLRAVLGAAIAVGLALLWVGPVAAEQPTRTVVYAGPVGHFAAGTACEFDVTVYRTPGSRTTFMDFPDGRGVAQNHAVHRRITNDATGAAFVESSVYREVDRFEGDLIRGTISGQSIWQFFPGDVGPDGVVLDHLLALFIRGEVTYVVNGVTGATLEISIRGTTTDICAAIS